MQSKLNYTIRRAKKSALLILYPSINIIKMKKINLIIAAIFFFVCSIKAQTPGDNIISFIEKVPSAAMDMPYKIEKKYGVPTTATTSSKWTVVPENLWSSLLKLKKGINADGRTITQIKSYKKFDIGEYGLMTGVLFVVEYTKNEKKDNDVIFAVYHNHMKSLVSQKSIFDLIEETPASKTLFKGIAAHEYTVEVLGNATFISTTKFKKGTDEDSVFKLSEVDAISGEIIEQVQ